VETLFTVLSLLAAVISVLFGMLVFSKDHRSSLSRVFILLCATMSYWAFAEFQMRVAETADLAHFWLRANCLWPFVLVLLFHFILIFTRQRWLLERKLTYFLLYGSAAVFSLVDLTTEQLSAGPAKEYWGWTYIYPDTLASQLKTVYVIVLGLVAGWFAVRFYLTRKKGSVARKQSALVLTGLALPVIIGTLGDAILPLFGIRTPELTDVAFAAGTASLIGFAIWRYQLFAVTPAGAADQIISTMSDSLILVNPEGNISTVNRAALDLLGYSEETLVGRNVRVLFREEGCKDSLIAQKNTNTCFLGISDVEISLIDRDGREITVSLSSSALREKDGRLLGTILIARDVSERRRTEERIVVQSQKIENANTELRTLQQISDVINQTIELDELLALALDTITDLRIFQFMHKGGIFLVEGDRLNLVASLGHSREFTTAHENVNIGDCLCGIAARTGELIVSSHSLGDSRHTICYAGMEDHGHAIVPIKTGEKVVGVMYLYLPAGAELAESEHNLLLTIGNQLAVCIENARLFEETRVLSLHDPLTGLANRNLMDMELKKDFMWAKRNHNPISVIMLDLDHFKDYNDAYGHPAGDRLLVDLAAQLIREIREIDLAVRYGGEEFLIIQPDTSTEQAAEVAERIRKSVAATGFSRKGSPERTRITISLGVASSDESVHSSNILIARADTSLYRAKANGRNRVEVFRQKLNIS